MSTSNSRMKTAAGSVGTAAAIGAAAAAFAVFGAPAASAATLNNLTVAQGLSFGPAAQYGTGCSYDVTVDTASTHTVEFSVHKDGAVNWTAIGTSTPESGTAHAVWMPSDGPGVYDVRAVAGQEGTANIEVYVGNGINLGSMCLVL